jgi:hypothetical protein
MFWSHKCLFLNRYQSSALEEMNSLSITLPNGQTDHPDIYSKRVVTSNGYLLAIILSAT